VFEEAHLGVVETGSIAGLARRYRLQGLLAGLLLVAILFVWNRSVAFPPASRFEREKEPVVAGSDSGLMFASLLSRHIAPDSVVDVCVAEWNRLRPNKRLPTPLVSPGDRDRKAPLATYLKMQDELKRKKTVTP
jgi:hypothetical protein